MKLAHLKLRQLALRLQEPFHTSYGTEWDKPVIIVELTTDTGDTGYAECVAMPNPFYTEENVGTAWLMLTRYLAGMLRNTVIKNVQDLMIVSNRFLAVKGHQMAKASLEMAAWDAFAAYSGQPLVTLLGGEKAEISVGISVGMQPSISQLVDTVRRHLSHGYQRVKIKIQPGYDIEPLTALRRAFPNLLLMADANSAYTLSDIRQLQQLDELNLMMIEQPLGYDDLVDHASLQHQLKTPICLDESIRSMDDVRRAVELGAGRVINLKVGRVGGFAEALRILQFCDHHQVDVWCGGMLETGIGRLHNIALTAVRGITMPGDTAPSAHYFAEDIIIPPVEFSRPGFLPVERLPGVGQRVLRDRMEHATVQELSIPLI